MLVPTIPDSFLFRTPVGPLPISFGLTLEYWWCVLVVVLHCLTYRIRGLSLLLALPFARRLQPRRTNHRLRHRSQKSLSHHLVCHWLEPTPPLP